MVDESIKQTNVNSSRTTRQLGSEYVKPNYPSVKLFQSDLYDSIKQDGNHIVSLSQSQIRSFLLFAILKNHAHELHPDYGAKLTILVEPDRKLSEDRERLIRNHSDLKVVNLFKSDDNHSPDNSHDKVYENSIDVSTQVVIGPIQKIIDDRNISCRTVKLVIIDNAHELVVGDIKLVKNLLQFLENTYSKRCKPKLLVFMSSFIHNNNELSPKDTVNLIEEFEKLFNAKCETSGDLRSISRQSPSAPVKIIEFETSGMVFDEHYLLADQILKEFSEFLIDPSLEDTEPIIKPDPDITDVILQRSQDTPLMTINEQLALVRSCLSDCLYSIHYLGLWCSKTLIKSYLTEFSRLLSDKQSVGDLIGSATSTLNIFYGRIESIIENHSKTFGKDLVYKASSKNLQTLLDAILQFKPNQTVKSSWPVCIINVRRRMVAKVIALWLEKIANNMSEYDFIKPNYIVDSSRKHRNRMAVDNFDLHHEAAVRDVRFGYCNVLVSSVISHERSTDMPRCNLVISFDIPSQFSEFIQSKGNCRYDASLYMIFVDKNLEPHAKDRMISYVNMERLLTEADNKFDRDIKANESSTEYYDKIYVPYPNAESRNSATLAKAIGIVNRYCAKLPSDSFTKLSHEWETHDCIDENGKRAYFCEIRLPVNSPVRQIIIGSAAPTKKLATKLAAYSACKLLHRQGELDDHMSPITKETFKTINPPASVVALREAGMTRLPKANNRAGGKGLSLGTTKHRQYYRKSIAKVFSSEPISEGKDCYLYKFNMILTCPIPDEQNRRGRRIVDPGETNRNYAIVCTSKLPKICTFPVFTRSGEVLISVELAKEHFALTKDQVNGLRAFHQFTFSKVLRLEKYPTKFDPDNSSFTVTLAPVVDLPTGGSEIDWKFVDLIENSTNEAKCPTLPQRRQFEFKHEDYVDAVVIPWYRSTERQQFAYYVAEICTDLTPLSDFPDKESGFGTFVDYYKTKYDLNIFNMDQPVLDVDHTSARLNLLTPRYVNRKGRTLPSSTAKSRRESRESLVQKQLLVPELCNIHPFPASFWRKAVCLPCIFYRLNSLYLAEELRRQVAKEVGIGVVDTPAEFSWPNLDFGWSLKEVVNCNSKIGNQNDKTTAISKSTQQNKKHVPNKQSKRIGLCINPSNQNDTATSKGPVDQQQNSLTKNSSSTDESNDSNDFVIDTFDPSKVQIPGWDACGEEIDDDDDDLGLVMLPETSNVEEQWHMINKSQQQQISTSFNSQLSSSTTNDFVILSSSASIGEAKPFPTRMFPSVMGENDFDDFESCSDDLEFQDNIINNKTIAEQDDDFSDDYDLDGDEEGEESWTGPPHQSAACTYGPWKDSKMKNQPLLRELISPISRYHSGQDQNYTRQLFDILMTSDENKPIFSSTNGSVMSDDGLAETIIERLECQSDLALLMKLGDEYKPLPKMNLDKTGVQKSTSSWLSIMNTLSDRVELGLNRNPELFKKVGLELVSVDDSYTGVPLPNEIQPTFGELLPNRENQSNWTEDDWKNLRFDPTTDEINSMGPSPSVILQALTMSNASDGINLERLETVGDSFLKYSITAYLHCTQPLMHEGKLSYLRSTEISNANLYLLGRKKQLGELMSATKFEPNDNWLAPGYTVSSNSAGPPINSESTCIHENHRQQSVSNESPLTLNRPNTNGTVSGDSGTGLPGERNEIDKALAEVPYDLIQQHSIADKSIADCVEALIGAYLTSSGSRAALLFMHWLGLRVLPESFDLETEKKRTDIDNKTRWHWLDTPRSPLICMQPYYDPEPRQPGLSEDQEVFAENDTHTDEVFVDGYDNNSIPNYVKPFMKRPEEIRRQAEEELMRLYHGNNLNKFEEQIQYTFRDKAFLVQAFTHNSFYENHVTDCHQRLEFLGDALLDYLITRYLFEDPRCHSPGTLTDLRSALVNNTFFASLAVKYKFHKYLQYISDELFQVIDKFVNKFRVDFKHTITKGYTLLISEGESEYAEDIEVPKALGDVFESVAGAIYLDSGMSLDRVWQVYFRMMKPEIEYFSCNVPKSPIRELLESMPQNVRFSPSELAPDRKHRVIAEVFGLGRFVGVGRNKHSAKSTAAKRALRMLSLRGLETKSS